MKAFSETSVTTCLLTSFRIPEELKLQQSCCEDLKARPYKPNETVTIISTKFCVYGLIWSFRIKINSESLLPGKFSTPKSGKTFASVWRAAGLNLRNAFLKSRKFPFTNYSDTTGNLHNLEVCGKPQEVRIATTCLYCSYNEVKICYRNSNFNVLKM
jgi:hypothetical protein